MQKATHFGECQACGRQQKLPGGVLAAHGYTKRWGFFQGQCPGSHRAPYELSCDFVKQCMESSQEEMEKLGRRIEQHLAGIDPVLVRRRKVHNYRPYYTWETPVSIDEKTRRVRFDDGKEVDPGLYPRAGETIEQLLRKRYARELEQEQNNHERYVMWATQRINEWTEQPLKPVN